MPKRSYPFDENLLPQIKTHVREKEVNNGVSSAERMQNVYDKTLNLLKAGARACSYKLNTSLQTESIKLLCKQPQPLAPCKLKFTSSSKQMLLNNNLQLETSDKIINDIRMDVCGCCRIDQPMLNRCYYCDQVLCSSCLSACCTCSELFCQNCSLPMYNSKEQNMCLNCYR